MSRSTPFARLSSNFICSSILRVLSNAAAMSREPLSRGITEGPSLTRSFNKFITVLLSISIIYFSCIASPPNEVMRLISMMIAAPARSGSLSSSA